MKTITIQVKIIPNSNKNEIVQLEKEFLKIKIKKPQKNQLANKELVSFLEKTFKADIKILKGKTIKKKLILIKNLNKQSIDILKKFSII